MSDYDEDTEAAAWAQLDLEARRFAEAIDKWDREFKEWLRETFEQPRRKEMNSNGTERI